QVGDDSLKAGRVRAPAAEAVAVLDLNPVAVGAVQEEVTRLLRQFLPWSLEIYAVALGDGLGELVVVVRGAHCPGRDRPLPDRQRRVRHHELGIDLHLRAETGA